MQQRNYQVSGFLTLPLTFNVRAESKQAAVEYAKKLFNSKEILKIEMECESRKGKSHLIIADSFDFTWKKAE